MINICLNNKQIGQVASTNYDEIVEVIVQSTCFNPDEFYLEQQGKRLTGATVTSENGDVHCVLRLRGGKGGFGSMLRAIGAQIEKTTNREACRDLSGRRLRDINEEKRLKAWLDKQGEREREAEERKKRKLEKLLAVPKHEFKDADYEEARSKLTEKVSDAVEEGIKQAEENKKAVTSGGDGTAPKTLKRKGANAVGGKIKAAKKKTALWIGDISDTDSSEENDSSADEDKKKTNENEKQAKMNDVKATKK